VEGELDQHDLIVQAWKENVRQKYEEERRHREAFWEQVSTSSETSEGGSESMPTPKVVGYDASQLSSILSAKKNTRKIYESAAERQEHVYQAHLKRVPATTQQPSLDEQLSQRKSHLRVDSQE
jgi:hypothetical protein